MPIIKDQQSESVSTTQSTNKNQTMHKIVIKETIRERESVIDVTDKQLEEYMRQNYYQSNQETNENVKPDSDEEKLHQSITLLCEHERMLRKLEELDPGKKSDSYKMAELQEKLIKVERELDMIQSTGFKLPRKYRRVSILSRFVNRVKHFCRKIWAAITNKGKSVKEALAVIGGALGIGLLITKRCFT
jgi:hypothetical protein